jgi:ATP-dependent DNA helicase UvrD/PcrA
VRDEADQARYVAEQVLEQRENGVALKSQAVLFRSSSHSAQLELELARRDIPYVKFGGLKFLEAAHIKDALSILKWADNPRNRLAGFRALQLLPRVGPATATQLLDVLDEAADSKSVLQAFRMPAPAMADWKTLLPLVLALRAQTPNWPAELESVMRWYEPHLDRLYEDAAVRQGDLAQLQQIAATYSSRERFLTQITLDPPEATSDQAGVPGQDESAGGSEVPLEA